VKGGVIGFIAEILADRTGDTSKTSTLPAGVRRRCDMTKTDFEVISLGRERAHGAGIEARLVLTALAWVFNLQPRLILPIIKQ